jgi:membrane protein implicated in regulation of membrane protease activity
VFVPITRIFTIAMFGVICFALIVPMALHARNTFLAIGVSVLFAAYLVAQIVLWRRMNRRS